METVFSPPLPRLLKHFAGIALRGLRQRCLWAVVGFASNSVNVCVCKSVPSGHIRMFYVMQLDRLSL